jgi:hypothetical protein
VVVVDAAVGDGEQPQALVPYVLGDLVGLCPPGAGQRLFAAGQPDRCAGVEDGADGAFGDHEAGAGARVEDDAGAAAGEVEADLTGLAVLGLGDLVVKRRAGGQDRGVEGGAPSGGEDRAEQGVVENARALAAVGCLPSVQPRPAHG